MDDIDKPAGLEIAHYELGDTIGSGSFGKERIIKSREINLVYLVCRRQSYNLNRS